MEHFGIPLGRTLQYFKLLLNERSMAQVLNPDERILASAADIFLIGMTEYLEQAAKQMKDKLVKFLQNLNSRKSQI